MSNLLQTVKFREMTFFVSSRLTNCVNPKSFQPSFATRASPLCRFPFRLRRLLNLQNSAEADWLAQCHREFDVLLLALTV